jgi:hypothetical protein
MCWAQMETAALSWWKCFEAHVFIFICHIAIRIIEDTIHYGPNQTELGSKFWRNSGQNSGSGPFSRIFGPGVSGIIFYVSLSSGLFN